MRKGFTLVEMISVLIILSIVATIVTPNIYVSVRDYKNQLFETQLDNIKQSAKNWAVDNIKDLPISNEKSLAVKIKDLQDNGYIENNLDNPRNGGILDNSEIFVLITCDYIEDETGNLSSNYKYYYETYENVQDYIKEMAILYAKNNNLTSAKSITSTELKTNNYIENEIIYLDGSKLNIPNITVNIVVTTEDDSKTGDTIYNYSANIG